MKTVTILLTIFILSASQTYPIGDVDFPSLQGVWYQVASIPQDWEEYCKCTIFEFRPVISDKMNIETICRLNSSTGPQQKLGGVFEYTYTPVGKVPGEYEFIIDNRRIPAWYIKAADDYSFVILGQPKDFALTILSRVPQIGESTYQDLLNFLKDFTFETSEIEKTYQENDCIYTFEE